MFQIMFVEKPDGRMVIWTHKSGEESSHIFLLFTNQKSVESKKEVVSRLLEEYPDAEISGRRFHESPFAPYFDRAIVELIGPELAQRNFKIVLPEPQPA